MPGTTARALLCSAVALLAAGCGSAAAGAGPAAAPTAPLRSGPECAGSWTCVGQEAAAVGAPVLAPPEGDGQQLVQAVAFERAPGTWQVTYAYTPPGSTNRATTLTGVRGDGWRMPARSGHPATVQVRGAAGTWDAGRRELSWQADGWHWRLTFPHGTTGPQALDSAGQLVPQAPAPAQA